MNENKLGYKFIKMHASGNDFVFFDNVSDLNKNEIVRLGSRHFGIGFDQAIFIEGQIKNEAGLQEINVKIYNADGSIAGMCGNAMRCLSGLKLQDGESALVNIKHGRQTKILRKGNIASVLMPKPVLNKETGVINIGNDHKVFIINNISEVDEKMSSEYNKNYVRIIDKSSIFITTIERGVGKTFACGSGISASCWYLYETGILKADNIKVTTNGNDAFRALYGEDDNIGVTIEQGCPVLKGSWQFVFSGEI